MEIDDKSDIYSIKKSKNINYKSNEYLCIELEENDFIFNKNDKLGILLENKIEYISRVEYIEDKYILCKRIENRIDDNYKVINISLQNTIKLFID